jgi:uncharacterized protein YvpB
MMILWQGIKVTFGFFLIAGLVFASGIFTMLLYAKYTGTVPFLFREAQMPLSATAVTLLSQQTPVPKPAKPISAMVDAPVIKQTPELPAGCEVTSLAMLLQYKGINKSKLELASEMPKDTTPVVFNNDGNIHYWGNPNIGFVGDVTRKAMGFGIYHAGLFPLLKQYIASALDLTEKPFNTYEEQIATGIPVIVWTTIDYAVPANWLVWDTSLGPIKTSFSEHAVLLVGYDDSSYYVNDPLSDVKNAKINKEQFIKSWEAMGKQGLSYK